MPTRRKLAAAGWRGWREGERARASCESVFSLMSFRVRRFLFLLQRSFLYTSQFVSFVSESRVRVRVRVRVCVCVCACVYPPCAYPSSLLFFCVINGGNKLFFFPYDHRSTGGAHTKQAFYTDDSLVKTISRTSFQWRNK